MNIDFFVLVLSFLFLFKSFALADCSNYSAKQLLQTLYLSTNGIEWNQPWDLTEGDICKYHGVSCVDNKLDLSNNNLNGDIPAVFWCIDVFKSIDLSANPRLSGNFSHLEKTNNLKHLNVAESNFYGPFPSIKKMKSRFILSYLDLSQTCVSGEVPEEISNLVSLTTLRAPRSLLSGNLTTSLYELPLVHLDLSCNLINSTDFNYEKFRQEKNLTFEDAPDITYAKPGHPCLNQYPFACNITSIDERDKFCDLVLKSKISNFTFCMIEDGDYLPISYDKTDIEHCFDIGRLIKRNDYAHCYFYPPENLALPSKLHEECQNLVCIHTQATKSSGCVDDINAAFSCAVHGGKVYEKPLINPDKKFCNLCWAHQTLGTPFINEFETLNGPETVIVDDCSIYCTLNNSDYFKPFMGDELVEKCKIAKDVSLDPEKPLCLFPNLTFVSLTETFNSDLEFIFNCFEMNGLTVFDCEYSLGLPAKSPSKAICEQCYTNSQIFCESQSTCLDNTDADTHCFNNTMCCGKCPDSSLLPEENFYEQCPVVVSARDLLLSFYGLYKSWPLSYNWREHKDFCDFKGVDCETRSLNLDNLPIMLKNADDKKKAGILLICMSRYLDQISASRTNIGIELPQFFGPFIKTLMLRSSGVVGTFPKSLYCTSLLKYLDLSSNKITGNIPYSIGELPHLQSLDLYRTSIEGILPTSLYKLKFVQSIDFRGTKVTESNSNGFKFDTMKNITTGTIMYDQSATQTGRERFAKFSRIH